MEVSLIMKNTYFPTNEISINFSKRLASLGGKTNALQMVSKTDPNKIKAKQDIKKKQRTNIEVRKKSMSKAQIYLDPGESNDDCSRSQQSQNSYSDSCSVFQGVHNISSNVRKELMNSTFKSSHTIQVKPKSSLDICKRNILNVAKKGYNKIRQSKTISIIQSTKHREQMDDQNTVQFQVKNSVKKINLFSTPICTPNKDRDYASGKESETKNDEEDIKMSTINGEGKYNKRIKNNKFTLEGESIATPAAEYIIQNEDNDYSDYELSSQQSSPLDCIDEPTSQTSNTRQNVNSEENIDYSFHERSSVTSSPYHYMNESITQADSGSDVLPQHSPLHYVSLGSYSVSISHCTFFYRPYMEKFCKHTYHHHYTILGYHTNRMYSTNMLYFFKSFFICNLY
jgi:hypothetical protein